MGNYHIKDGTPGDYLAHYGVKGMRWGVRKEDELSPRELAAHNEKTKEYMGQISTLPGPKTRAEGEANLAANQAKFEAKFQPSQPKDDGKFKLSDAQKKALFITAGVGAYVGLNMYGEKLAGKALGGMMGGKPNWVQDMDGLAGKPVPSSGHYQDLVSYSQAHTWFAGNYLTDSAFARPAYEIPAGTTFHRISSHSDEKDFKPGTYSTHSEADFNRYMSGFSGELGGQNAKLHHVTWQNKEPTKVPDLTTVLDHLGRTMQQSTGASKPPKAKEVMQAYNSMSGGGWDSGHARGLMDSLKKSGYGALVDEMDAGVIGSTPIVFFGHEHATSKQSSPLSQKSFKEAESKLLEIEKPPGRKP